MSQAIVRCLNRRLGLVNPDEAAPRLLGGLVACITVVFCSTVLYYAIIARFFGRAARQGSLNSDVAEAMFNPYIVLGLSLFFILGLPFAAWYEGVEDPDKASKMGCGSMATGYLGGGILKAMRVLVPRKSPLTHPQFQLATGWLCSNRWPPMRWPRASFQPIRS